MSIDIVTREYLLGDLVSVSQGLAINAKTKHLLVDSGIPLLRISDLISKTYSQFVDRDRAPKKCLAEVGDLIYSRTGQVGLVFKDQAGVIHNNCFKISVTSSALEKDFLYWYLKQARVREYVNSVASGSVQKDLNHSAFKSLSIKLPTLSNQKFAVKILDSLEEKIQLNHRINQTLEQIAQALFKSWFVDFEPVKAKIAAKARWQATQPSAESASPVCYADELQPQAAAADLETTMSLAAVQAISGKDQHQLAQLQAEQPEQYAQLKATAELFPSAMQDDSQGCANAAGGRMPGVASDLGETNSSGTNLDAESAPEGGGTGMRRLIPEGWELGKLGDLIELHRGFDLPAKKRIDGEIPVYAAGGLHGTHAKYKMEPPGVITGRSGVIGNVYLSLERYWPLNTTLYVRKFRRCGPFYALHLLRRLDLRSFNSGSAVPSLNRNFVHALPLHMPTDGVLAAFESVVRPLYQAMASFERECKELETVRGTLLPKLISGEITPPEAEVRVAEATNV